MSYPGNRGRGRGRGRGAPAGESIPPPPPYDDAAKGTQDAAPSASSADRPKTQSRGRGRGGRGGRGKPAPPTFTKVENPDLTPKAQSSQASTEKNDPMINASVLIPGLSGFVERNSRRDFKIDASSFMLLIRTSYDSLCTADRSLKKYVSFGMYQYYCVILFWRRYWQIISARGPKSVEYVQMTNYLSEDLPIPQEIAAYLTGMGEVVDQSGRRFYLAPPTDFDAARVNGAQGHFGAIGNLTHMDYETLPAPWIALMQVQSEYDRAIAPANPLAWVVDPAILPVPFGAATTNLLGWQHAIPMTTEQRGIAEQVGFAPTPAGGNPVLPNISVGRCPIAQQLVTAVGGYLKSAKTPVTGVFPDSIKGSVAQIPYTRRDINDVAADGRAISLRNGITHSYCSYPVHIASASAIMKYRQERRRVGQANDDMFCVTVVPAANLPVWQANEQSVFNHGDAAVLWNTDQFSLPVMNGLQTATEYSDRTRAPISKQ